MKLRGRFRTYFGRAHTQTSPAIVPEALGVQEHPLFVEAERSIIRLVELLIERAYAARASDVHLDPRGAGLMVRMRIDGMLQDAYELDRSMHLEIISRIKILSGLRIDEHFAPQDGRFRAQCNDTSIDVRVSVAPTYYGENAVLRLLASAAETFALDSLGLTVVNRKKLLRALARPHGMILATGPTGSGKTTTLYALVRALNTPDVSIITLEDPIEYSIAGIRQIQVNPKTGLSFGSGLRSILRQDPNIIMVGEIRDKETAGLAINTSLTGHLILSTLHTNDAPTTVVRLLDMHVEPYLIASTLSVAIGQRLVRRICEGCKVPYSITEESMQSLVAILPQELENHTTWYKGSGCDACNGSGYKGRAGIHEVLVVEGAVRDAILSRATASELRTIAIHDGMTPMVLDGLRKASRGITTIEEVLRMQYE